MRLCGLSGKIVFSLICLPAADDKLGEYQARSDCRYIVDCPWLYSLALQRDDSVEELLSPERFEVFRRRLRRVLQAGAVQPRGLDHCFGGDIEQMTDEFVRVQGLDAILRVEKAPNDGTEATVGVPGRRRRGRRAPLRGRRCSCACEP